MFTNTASFDPTVTGDGTSIAQQLTFDFGTLVNANRDNTALETLVLTYTARVTDIAANTSNGSGAGTMLDNSAVFAWDAGGAPGEHSGCGCRRHRGDRARIEYHQDESATTRPSWVKRSPTRW